MVVHSRSSVEKFHIIKEITAKGPKGFARLHFHSIIDGDEASSRHSILNKERRVKHAKRIDLNHFSLPALGRASARPGRPSRFLANFAVKLLEHELSDHASRVPFPINEFVFPEGTCRWKRVLVLPSNCRIQI